MQDKAFTHCADGITRVKAELNELHCTLAVMGYSEVFVDKLGGDVVSVVRYSPALHRSVVLVARLVCQYP